MNAVTSMKGSRTGHEIQAVRRQTVFYPNIVQLLPEFLGNLHQKMRVYEVFLSFYVDISWFVEINSGLS